MLVESTLLSTLAVESQLWTSTRRILHIIMFVFIACICLVHVHIVLVWFNQFSGKATSTLYEKLNECINSNLNYSGLSGKCIYTYKCVCLKLIHKCDPTNGFLHTNAHGKTLITRLRPLCT